MTTPQSSPLDALFRPPVLIAMLLAGEALALVISLSSPAGAGGMLVKLGLASLGIQWIAFGTLFLLFILRRPLSRLAPQAIAWFCLAMLLGMTIPVTSTAWVLLELAANSAEPWISFVLRMLAITFVVGLLALLTYQNYWRARQIALRAKQLELETLKARVRPHFLFNALNTAVSLAHTRPDYVERVLLDLADLFRAALREPEMVDLSKELDLMRYYLEIEALRFGERLQVHWDLPEALSKVAVPALSLQPLAENAILHGIERLPNGGRVDIRVQCDPDWVQIQIENDVPAEALPLERSHGIGLASSRQRIHEASGGRGSVVTQREEGRHIATVRLPAR
jgi:two-component system sensor histidine kinase AlgZ